MRFSPPERIREPPVACAECAAGGKFCSAVSVDSSQTMHSRRRSSLSRRSQASGSRPAVIRHPGERQDLVVARHLDLQKYSRYAYTCMCCAACLRFEPWTQWTRTAPCGGSAFEEAVEDLYGRGMMHGTMHLSIGQVKRCPPAPAPPRKTVTRSRPPTAGTATASPRGPTWAASMAELLARDNGYCRGGSMHRGRRHRQPGRQRHRRGRSADAIAAGAALSNKLRGTDQVPSHGDGEGARHEAMTLARCGTCRWCSSARTTSTACRCRARRRSRSST